MNAAAILIGGIAAAATLFLSPTAQAQYTWSGTVSGQWSVPGNWVGGLAPPPSGASTLTFPASPNQAVTLDIGPAELNSLTTSAAYSFSGDPFIFVGTLATMTSGGGALAFANDVFYDVPLTVVANTNVTFGTLGGDAGLVKQGSGLMTVTALVGNGPVAVEAGTLTASPAASPSTRTLTISGGANVNTGPASWGGLSGAGNLAITGNTTFNGAANTTFTGNVTGGAFAFRKGSTGTLTLLGNNTYTGTTTVVAGRLEVGNGANGTFASGPVSVSANATLALDATNAALITSIVGPGTVEVNGGTVSDSGAGWSYPGNLTVNGGSVTTTFLGTPGMLTVNQPGTLTINGGGAVASVAGNGSVILNGAANLFINNATPQTFAGVISGTGNLIKEGASTLTLSGANTYTGATSVAGGLLLITGSVAGNVFLGAGSAVGGTGSIGGTLDAPLGSTVQPGVSPGILGSGSVNMTSSTFAVEILGNAPGTGHDQLDVTGTVNVTNATLALSGAYVPAAGDTYVIVNNDGADAVTGTFAGLVEGGTVAFNGRTLRISYVGGTGNDITLAPLTITVTASAGSNGTISPSGAVPVAQGGAATFTVTPDPGYGAVIGGTCPAGSLAGTTYTTGTLNTACTVTATFALNTYSVTPSAGANGTISPATPQTIAHGSTATFTVTPDAGYSAAVGGTCGGTLAGTTYTTGVITAACSVAATFTLDAVTTFTGPTATGTGTATASFTGGGVACSFAPQGSGATQSAFFIPVEGHAKSPPAGTAPSGTAFPHGLLDFVLINCTQGGSIAFTVTYPTALPPGTQYWKFGPTSGNATPHWYILPATVSGNTATFTITDGGLGDDDLLVNGTVVDQGGPGVPPGTGAIQTPTLSEWALIVLALLTLLIGTRRLGPRPR